MLEKRWQLRSRHGNYTGMVLKIVKTTSTNGIHNSLTSAVLVQKCVTVKSILATLVDDSKHDGQRQVLEYVTMKVSAAVSLMIRSCTK